MARVAAIDLGTNAVQLLVADVEAQRAPVAVLERTELTRLGRGVDRTGKLAPEAIRETVAVLRAFAEQARGLGTTALVACATSAARDAQNGEELIALARRALGAELEILSGDEEARLCFAAAEADFGRPGRALVVLDIGGGSTEVIYGVDRALAYHHSFDVGSVRLTERFGGRRKAIEGQLVSTFAALPVPPSGFELIAVAGTATTLWLVQRGEDAAVGAAAHGQPLTGAEVGALTTRLWSMSAQDRQALRGLPERRADVLPAGAAILKAAMHAVGASACTVSDRGLRWGLLRDRFGRG